MRLVGILQKFVVIIAVCLCANAASRHQHFFATKNTYTSAREYLHGSDAEIAAKHKQLEREVNAKRCQAVHINSLARHGIRNPGPKDVQKTDAFFKRFEQFVFDYGLAETRIAKRLHAAMRQWFQSDLFPNALLSDKKLTQTGYVEMFAIGQFVARHYRTLLSDPEVVEFVSSDKQRAMQSCEAFRHGAGIDAAAGSSAPRCEVDNHLMRFFDDCPHYVLKMLNDTTLREAEVFKIGPEMTALVEKLQRNLVPDASSALFDVGYCKSTPQT